MTNAVSHYAGLRPIRLAPESSAGYLRLPIVVAGGAARLRNDRDALRAGVAASYPMALPDLPALRDRIVSSSDRLTGASLLAQHLFTLPTHSRVGVRERERLLRILDKAIGSRIVVPGNVSSDAEASR
jgi:hypothetical protein